MRFPDWSDSEAERLRTTLKITKCQVHRVFEILRLASIDPKNDTEMKSFRLFVKKRLMKSNKEELAIFHNDSEGRKKMLQEMYDELEGKYKDILRKARLR